MSSRRSTGARGGARALVAGLTGALVASALTATSAFAEPSGEIDSIVTAEAVAEDDGPAPVFQSEAAQRANTGLWVVQLEKPSAARYGGGEPGLAATSPKPPEASVSMSTMPRSSATPITSAASTRSSSLEPRKPWVAACRSRPSSRSWSMA